MNIQDLKFLNWVEQWAFLPGLVVGELQELGVPAPTAYLISRHPSVRDRSLLGFYRSFGQSDPEFFQKFLDYWKLRYKKAGGLLTESTQSDFIKSAFVDKEAFHELSAAVRQVVDARCGLALKTTEKEPDAYRWRFLEGKDKTWRHQTALPGFDPSIVEVETLHVGTKVLPTGVYPK